MRRAGVLLLVAAAIVAAPATLRADADADALKAYDKGRKAVEAGQFAEAVTSLQEALAARPAEGSFKMGARVVGYAPSRWLAEAHLGLKQCEQAKAAADRAASVKMSDADARGLDAVKARIGAECRGGGDETCAAAADAEKALAAGDLAQARRLAGSCRKGDAVATRVLQGVDSELRRLVGEADGACGRGDRAGAERLLAQVVAVDPSLAAAVALQGRVAAGACAGGVVTCPGAAEAEQAFAARDLKKALERARTCPQEDERARAVIAKVAAELDKLVAAADRACSERRGDEARRNVTQVLEVDGRHAGALRLQGRIDARGCEPSGPSGATQQLECAAAAEAEGALRQNDLKRAVELARSCPPGDRRARDVIDEVGRRLDDKVRQAEAECAAGREPNATRLLGEVLGVDPARPRALVVQAQIGSQGCKADPVRAAWLLYAKGDVDAAIALLEGTRDISPTGHVVLACSLATRALLKTPPDASPTGEDASRARAEWSVAKAGKPSLTLDKPWISPRVRELLQGP